MNRFIAIDPGDVHVGACTFEHDVFKTALEYRPEDIPTLLRSTSFDTIILESFVVYPGKSRVQTFSKMETPQLIGIIKSEAKSLSIPLVLQQASLRKVAERSPWVKAHIQTYGKPSSRHAWDAILHAYYYRYFSKKRIPA